RGGQPAVFRPPGGGFTEARGGQLAPSQDVAHNHIESEAATIIALFHSNISFSSPGFVLRENKNMTQNTADKGFVNPGNDGSTQEIMEKDGESRMARGAPRFALLWRKRQAAAVQGLRRKDMKRDKLVTAAPLSSASPNMRALFRHGMELRVRAVQHHGCQTDPCQARRRGRRDQIARESSIRSFRTRGSLRCALTAISGTKAF
ncbi:Ras-related protein Rab-10, partial [Dissostichus eleginoides]